MSDSLDIEKIAPELDRDSKIRLAEVIAANVERSNALAARANELAEVLKREIESIQDKSLRIAVRSR